MKKIATVLIFQLLMLAAPSFAQTSLEQRVLFQPDSVNIMESQEAQISMMADYIKSHPNVTIIVAGFVSTLTNSQKADAIAQQRAENVSRYLTERSGVPSSRLVPIGVGIGKRYDQPEFNEVVSFFKK